MNKKPLRTLSLLLTVLMLLSLIAVSVLAEDHTSELVTTQIVIKDDSIVLGQNGLSSPDISYNDSTKVTTLKMTTDVADGDNTYFTVSLADINAKKTPYIVLGAANSTPGNYDVSIGYKNGYNPERDYEHKPSASTARPMLFRTPIQTLLSMQQSTQAVTPDGMMPTVFGTMPDTMLSLRKILPSIISESV